MSKIPTIAMIPSGYKANKVYSVLPTNGDADLSFSRTSEATRVNQLGLIEEVATNVPRLDYSDGGCPALLLEPQRSNLVPYSSEINDTRWTNNYGGTGVEPIMNSSTELAKDGTLSACEWVFNTGSGTTIADQSSIYYSSIPTSVGVTYSFSVWVYSSLNNVEIQLRGADTVYEKFTLTIGWNKITRIAEATSTSTLPIIGLRQSVNGTVNSNITVSLWGAQFEKGSYATSYIPTQGGAVTRVAESCSQTVPSGIIGQTEGTMFVDFNIDTGQGIGGIIELINPLDTSSRVLLWDAYAYDNYINLQAFFSAKSNSITLNNVSVGNHKAVLIYNNSFTKFFLDGVKIGEEVSNNPYSDMNKIDFNHVAGGVGFQQKRIKSVKLYNTALTDQEAITLTTI